MSARRPLAALAVAALALAACSSDDGGGGTTTTAESAAAPTTTTAPTGPVASAGCDTSPVAAPGTTDRTMRSAGGLRHFQLVVPEGYDGTTPLPVVMGLHALTVNYAVLPALYGFDEAPEPVIAVYPSGLLDAGTPYWVAVPVPGNRDVRFISDLLDLVEDELCVDTTQVFSNGMSNGAQMSSLLACVMSDRIAAVMVVAGAEFSTDCDGRPVPVLAFHGDADPIVTYEGGGLNATTIAEQNYFHGPAPAGLPVHGGVDSAMENWAAHNGCDAGPEEEQISDEVVHRTWTGCEAPTELYVVLGGGHSWPGRPIGNGEFGPTTTDVDATALMYEFFLG